MLDGRRQPHRAEGLPGTPSSLGHTDPVATSRTISGGAVVRAASFALLLLAGCAVALLVDVPDVSTLRDWRASLGTAGWVALVAGLSVATLAPVPRTALSVLAGVLAGFWGGLALALTSGVLGALAGFGLARWLGRESVTRLAGPRLARADALLTRRGAVAVMAARVLPVVPFTVVSYAAGVSGLRLRSYVVGSVVGLAPGTLLHVTLGATVGSAGAVGRPVLLVSLVPLALLLGVLALRGARRPRRTAARAEA